MKARKVAENATSSSPRRQSATSDQIAPAAAAAATGQPTASLKIMTRYAPSPANGPPPIARSMSTSRTCATSLIAFCRSTRMNGVPAKNPITAPAVLHKNSRPDSRQFPDRLTSATATAIIEKAMKTT